MKFKRIPTSKAENTILAHSVLLKEGKLKKGKLLNKEDIKLLKSNSVNKIFVAIIERNDIHENKAADRIAKHIVSKEIIHLKAVNGRADFYSRIDGILNFDVKKMASLNYQNNDLALSALKQYSLVKKGQLVGNIKIIPYTVEKLKLDKVLQVQKFKNFFSIKSIKIKYVTLILSLDNLSQNTKKIISSIELRLKNFGLKLDIVCKTNHDSNSLCYELKKHFNKKDNLILIYGSASISDINDVIPSSIKKIRGKIISLGAPTDPGNLLLIASKNESMILGVPGCAKSLSRNGFDIVLERICYGIDVSKMMVSEMSNGGLYRNIIRKSGTF